MIKRNRIGFKLPWEKEDNHEPSVSTEAKEIDTIMKNLSKEIITCQEFENTLLKELRTIKDMDANLQNVNRQVSSMRKLVTTRDEIFRILMTEYHKGINMDIEKCKSLFEAINKINQEMDSSVKLAYNELSKLLIEQKHELYATSDENKRLMNILSEEAKTLNTEIILISEQHNSLHQRLISMHDHISRIAIERQKSR